MPRKLKPEYALMNKIIHDRIGPKGNEKYPSQEEIQFLYEVMTEKLIDYALVIWCIMRDFLQSLTESRHIPFPSLVTNLVEAAGMREVVKVKRVLPKLGPITSQTEAKSRAASTRPQPSHPPVAIPGASSSTAPAPTRPQHSHPPVAIRRASSSTAPAPMSTLMSLKVIYFQSIFLIDFYIKRLIYMQEYGITSLNLLCSREFKRKQNLQ